MRMPSNVFFLPWGKREKIDDLLETAGISDLLKKGDYVAVKTHFGEKGNKGHVKPEFFRPIIKKILAKRARTFLTDTNTIYHGDRNNAVGHLAIAAEHGFTYEALGVPIIIADGLHGHDYLEIETNTPHFKKVKIGSAVAEADTIIAVSHFKGHLMAGFGGAIKNLGMGCGARIGKFEMHSSAAPSISIDKCIGCGVCVNVCAHNALRVVNDKIKLDIKKCAGCGECILSCGQHAISVTWNEPGKNVQEKFAEYALGAVKGKKLFCITFLNNITPNCDCLSKAEPSIAPDVGILASFDPVACDQAGFDLIIKKTGKDVFKEAHPAIDHEVQIRHAEKIGLGKRAYKLTTL